MTTTKQYYSSFKALDEQFQFWLTVIKDISDFIMVGYGTYLDRGDIDSSQNVFRSDNILNDAATRAVRILGAGMQGGLCSPSRRWFRLKMEDDDLSEFAPVKQWLEAVEAKMYRMYSSSNFYTVIHSVFESEGGFGTAAMIQEEDVGPAAIKFRLFDAGEYRLALGQDYSVEGCYRNKQMTARQLADDFGENKLRPETRAMLSKPGQEYTPVEVMHVMKPNTGRNKEMVDSMNKEYESVWFEVGAGDNQFLRKSGYDMKPFVAPRWIAPGMSAYGMSPAHTIIGSVKMLQEYCKSGIMAVSREVNPPLNIPANFKDVISMLPGALNYASEGDARAKIEPVLNVRANLAGLGDLIAKTETGIERGFFNHLFLMILNADYSGREMTATEVLKRNEEKLLLLGPTLERQFSELLDPTIDRTFQIGLKRGLFPPPPLEVQGQNWDVEYISVLAQAQRLSDAQTLQAYRMEAMEVAQLDPMTLTKTNYDKYLDEYADILGVPPDVVRPEDESDKLRAEQAQAMQAQQEQEQMMEGASMANQLGGASTESGTALGDLVDQARGER